jgi:hypothetical protein
MDASRSNPVAFLATISVLFHCIQSAEKSGSRSTGPTYTQPIHAVTGSHQKIVHKSHPFITCRHALEAGPSGKKLIVLNGSHVMSPEFL